MYSKYAAFEAEFRAIQKYPLALNDKSLKPPTTDPITIIPKDNHIKPVILEANSLSSPNAITIIVKFLKTVNMATVRY